MKKKLRLSIVMMLIMCTILSGCSNPFNKDNTTPTDEAPVADNRITVTDVQVYNVGDIIGINDIITVQPDLAVTQSAILNEQGTIIEQLDTSTAGTFTVNLIVQFAEGDQWSNTYTYTVEGVDPLSLFPEELSKNLTEGAWSSKDLLLYHGETKTRISFMSDTQHIVNENAITGEDMSMAINEDATKNNWAWLVINKTGENSKETLSGSLLDTDVFTAMANVTKMITQRLEELASQGVGEMAEDDGDKSFEWLMDAMGSVGSLEEEPTGVSLYDIDGNAYPIIGVKAVVTGATKSGYLYQAFYIEYTDNTIIAFSPTSINGKSLSEYMSVSVPDDTDETDEETDNPTFETYEEVEAMVLEMIDYMVDGLSAGNEEILNNGLNVLVNQSIIGDYTTIVPQPTPEPTPTGEPVDGEFSVDEEGEPETETEAGAIANVKPSYQAQHPEIYTWPENDTKYRRWSYVVGEGVSYTGSIILPDGTVLSVEDGGSISQIDGSSTSGSGYTPDSESDDGITVTLMTSYNTYFVSNKEYPAITIDTTASTSSIVHMSNSSNKYYIESARATTINNYISACIYSTSGMSTDYTISENTTGKVVTDLGTITPYTIQYKDTNGKSQTKAYMAVYNINNDYLIIYADNMEDDMSNMVEMLTYMVS